MLAMSLRRSAKLNTFKQITNKPVKATKAFWLVITADKHTTKPITPKITLLAKDGKKNHIASAQALSSIPAQSKGTVQREPPKKENTYI